MAATAKKPAEGAKSSVKEEIEKTIKALKDGGFSPADAIFEGAIGVKEDATLKFMDQLSDAGLVSGVIRVVYTTGDNKIRFVEIPVGQQGGE